MNENKKTKVRLKITYITEYELIPEYYPGLKTEQEMMNYDIDSALEDPFGIIEGNGEWDVEGEIL